MDKEEPIDIESLPRAADLGWIGRWKQAVEEGGTDLGFDVWFESALIGAAGGRDGQPVQYRQGSVIFELQHGADFEIEQGGSAKRRFHCLMDGHVPFVSFYGDGDAERRPWISISRLFTAEELHTLILVPGPAA